MPRRCQNLRTDRMRLRAAARPLAAIAIAAMTFSGSCDPATNEPVFVSPPNGTLDVARFPVISVTYEEDLPANPTTLSTWVRLLDRTGQPVPLLVRRSDANLRVAIAVPASAEDRLMPASDYFLEVHPGKVDSVNAGRTYFRTGGAKSVLCVGRNGAADPWGSTCNETYWKGELGFGACADADPLGLVDGSCTCATDPGTPAIGGPKASCDCTEESGLITGPLSDYAVVSGVTPAAGDGTAGSGTSFRVELDRDLGASAASYGFDIDVIADGDEASARFSLPAVWIAQDKAFTSDPFTLAANGRYRVTLALRGTAEPSGVALASTHPHAFSWTFNTWSGPPGELARVVPTPKTPGVDFPTHLPPWPHLRFVYDGPITEGVADVEGPVLAVRPYHGGPAVDGRATWYDRDMNRLHLAVYETLAEGTRYEVFCTPAFAAAVGDPGCETTPIARFLTQVTPPDAGIDPAKDPSDEIFEGAWVEYEAANASRVLLPIRPTVLHDDYGVKEIYETDVAGPTHHVGHAMLVGPADPEPFAARIVVDPHAESPSCRRLEVPAEQHSGGDRYLSSEVCEVDEECATGYRCATCKNPGNAGCPTDEKRCRWSLSEFRSELLSYCTDLVNGTPACSIEDAYRCAAGGSETTAPSGKARMGASSQSECPTGYEFHPGVPGVSTSRNCVPRGRVELDLAPGEHFFTLATNQSASMYWDPQLADFVEEAPPVLFQSEDPSLPATLVSTVELADGVAIPADSCRTAGGPNQPVQCLESLGVCDTATGLCIATQQNAGEAQESIQGATAETCGSCFDGYTCHPTLDRCVIDPGTSAFDCTAGGCSAEWVQVDATHNIWRIWWPQRATSGGSRRYGATARIGDAAGGPLERLPLITGTIPDYGACDLTLDPKSCLLDACTAWNDTDYAGQIALQMDHLANHAEPIVGYYAAGYHVLKGGINDTAYDDGQGTPPPCTDLGPILSNSSSSGTDMDGPIGFFVKLPATEVPWDYSIHVSAVQETAAMTTPGRIEIRGVRFDGNPDGIYVTDGAAFHIHGSQFVDPKVGAAIVSTDSAGTVLGPVRFEDNFLSGAGSIAQSSDSSHYVTRGNLYWKVQKKVHTSAYGGSIQEPTFCSDGDPGCVVPRCRVDTDCRIPYLATNGDMDGADPALAGDHLTCDGVDPMTQIGTCSGGLIDQGLFMDNVLLDGSGPNNGPWYQFRMQRNHFENVAAQEAFDGEFGSAFVSILDNLFYHSQSSLNLFLIQDVPAAAPGGENWMTGIAVENNGVYRTGPYAKSQSARSGNARLAATSAGVLAMKPEDGGSGLISGAVRFVGNTITDLPGGREWGTSVSTAGSIWHTQGVRVDGNTVASESDHALNFLSESAALAGAGRAEGNLAFSTSRTSYAENLCTSLAPHDIRVGGNFDMDMCANASPDPSPSALDPTPGCEHLDVDPVAARERLFHEPRPGSPIIDFETLQRVLVPDLPDLWDRFRAWPGYDPAMEDDVLAVRPGNPACGFGSGDPSCEDGDPDGDLYQNSQDNCPSVANPSQADADGDGYGDACDAS